MAAASPPPVPTAGPEATWNQFRRTRSAKARNALVEWYMPIVWNVGSQVAASAPGKVEWDDLLSAGTVGLIEAIDRYDPVFGSPFECYCIVRVRGAMLDEVRRVNRVPRQQSAGRNSGCESSGQGGAGGAPWAGTEAGAKRHTAAAQSGQSSKPLSLRSSLSDVDGGSDLRGLNAVEAARTPDPAQLLLEKELRHSLAEEVMSLAATPRHIVLLYYYQGLTMKQIGEVLGVTESRVCQMHAEILQRLQRRLAMIMEERRCR